SRPHPPLSPSAHVAEGGRRDQARSESGHCAENRYPRDTSSAPVLRLWSNQPCSLSSAPLAFSLTAKVEWGIKCLAPIVLLVWLSLRCFVLHFLPPTGCSQMRPQK